MQDTPNFPSYKQQFTALSLPALLDAREPVPEPHRTLITQAYSKLNEYFTDDDFRRTLTIIRKNNIEAQIANILSQLTTLNQWQADGTPIAGANIESIASNISSYLEDFDSRFSIPHELYRLQGNNNLDEVVRTSLEAKSKIEETYSSVTKILSDASKIVGIGSSITLADHFQELSNGRTVVENTEFKSKTRSTIKFPESKWALPVSIVILFLLIDKAVDVFKNNHISMRTYITVATAILIPILVWSSIRAINKINTIHKGGYARTAFFWMLGAIFSTALTALYAAVLVFEMGDNPGWEEIVPKIIGLLAPAYFVRFCVQNYKANMHLSIQNTHRATIANVVRPFADLIEHPNPTFDKDVLDGKVELIKAAAAIVFTQSESGYLTTKEGAGGSDNMLDSLNRPSS